MLPDSASSAQSQGRLSGAPSSVNAESAAAPRDPVTFIIGNPVFSTLGKSSKISLKRDKRDFYEENSGSRGQMLFYGSDV